MRAWLQLDSSGWLLLCLLNPHQRGLVQEQSPQILRASTSALRFGYDVFCSVIPPMPSTVRSPSAILLYQLLCFCKRWDSCNSLLRVSSLLEYKLHEDSDHLLLSPWF